jgi:hypothetical protein
VAHNPPPAHTFTNTATRDGVHWIVRCDQYPSIHCRARLLAQAERLQRRAIAAHLGVPEAKIGVEIRPILPPAAEKHITRARELRGEGARDGGHTSVVGSRTPVLR